MSFRNAKGGYIRPGYDPLEVANPPTGAGASAGNQSASVSFTAPSNTGGGAITNYYAVSNPGQFTGSSVTSPISVTGLTNGTEYTFKVWGENSYGPSAYSAPTGSVTPVPPFIEDVFSTYLYTGNGSTQTITNGIDLSGEGGLVWFKSRSGAYNHALIDTVRGGGQVLSSNATSAQANYSPQGISAFNSNGFTFGTTTAELNNSSNTYASWTFRKAEKFFDVVTYTGNGADNRAIAHNLGSTPGCVILKCTSTGSTNWLVQHRSVAADRVLILNGTNASFGSNSFSDQYADSTSFYVDNTTESNNNGSTYVAYLFAHDAGGFGANGTDNVITCGSFTTDASGRTTVTLNYEPQWLLVKRTSGGTGNWEIADNMRGWTVSGNASLYPNLSNAENNPDNYKLNATGFSADNGAGSSDFIYIAIRRGPMKTPTTGTSVFEPLARSGTGAAATVTTTVRPDGVLQNWRSGGLGSASHFFYDRLRGVAKALFTDTTDAESTQTATGINAFNNLSYGIAGAGSMNNGSATYVDYIFTRAPGFFDEVCYTGNGTAGTAISHNLGVVPELVIVRKRSSTGPWNTLYQPSMRVLTLNASNEFKSASLTKFYFGNDSADVSPTSSTFTVASDAEINESGATFVSYLFASCSGVSKVGSYTGTGTTLQINCGFTGGARFVLIKRTDASASWYVWDSARGIVAGNDPYLLLNSTASEVDNTDYVDTYSAGFEISSTAPAAINANGGTFIYLAIS